MSTAPPSYTSSSPSTSVHPFSLLHEYRQKGYLSQFQCLDLGQQGGVWRAHVVASSHSHDQIWQHVASASTKAAAKKLAATAVLAEIESSSAPRPRKLMASHSFIADRLTVTVSRAEKKARAAENRAIQLGLAHLLAGYLTTTGITSPPFLLLSVDLEFYELDHHRVTEIGLAWCESTTFLDQDPIPNPKCCSHYIISENKCYRNGLYVPDQLDFFNFGLSLEVSLSDVPQTITDQVLKASNGLPVVLVGHSMQGDLARLQELGVCLEGIVTAEFDIGIAFQELEQAAERRGLGKMLEAFGIEHFHLHNAGNDSGYTLSAARHVLSIASVRASLK